MDREQVRTIFDQQAAGYDSQWARTAPIKDCLYLLVDACFAGLPTDASILCVGVGTGAEVGWLASRHPGWRFTAVEPSAPMLALCRQRAEREGYADRCLFHDGYLDTLPGDDVHDAATCFLVSQFILDPDRRTAFFNGIACRLAPGGLLASVDLASDVASRQYEVLLQAWMRMMSAAEISDAAIARMRSAYATDVAVLPATRIAAIIAAGGFAPPTPFFQAGLMHGWLSARAADAGASSAAMRGPRGTRP